MTLLMLIVAVFDLGPCADGELTADEFVAQADEICAQAHESFDELQPGPVRTPDEAADRTAALIDSAVEELEEVQELDAPDSIEPQLERYYTAREKGIKLLREGLEAARDEDPNAYETLQAELAGTQDERFALARKVGFRECSKPSLGPDELKRQAEAPPASDLDAPPEVNNPPT